MLARKEKKMNNHGIESGETCNRNGCKGIIDETEKRGCSCHINPPCSACTEPRAFCPSCGWDDADEREEYESNRKHSSEYAPDFFKVRTIADLDKSKIDYLYRPHTHFTMIKEGVFPIGTSKEELLNEIRGTFGGRFEYLTENRFKYVAYTD